MILPTSLGLTGTLMRTIAHFSLQLIKGNTTPELITQPAYVDPLTGDKVLLVGYSTLVPTGGP